MNEMDKMEITVSVDKHIQKLLSDEEYYRKYWIKDYEKTLLSRNFSVGDKRYNVLVQYCTGSLDGNGWIDITYWEEAHGGLREIACGEPVFEDGASNSYVIDGREIIITIEFEKEK